MEADFTTRAPSLARPFAAEANNNAWANHRLLAACTRLTQGEFTAPRTRFFPSITATLKHILTADKRLIALCDSLDERKLAMPVVLPRRADELRELGFSEKEIWR